MERYGTNAGLSESLERLEECLETPVVPGELENWLETARNACREVESNLQEEIAHKHPDLFKQTIRQDPALVPRINELNAKDAELQQQIQALSNHLARLSGRAERVEPHESALDESVENIVREGLALVVAVRTQETALATWYMESLNRDRGVAD
jgi:predicted nuclease with TOPRIM domain